MEWHHTHSCSQIISSFTTLSQWMYHILLELQSRKHVRIIRVRVSSLLVPLCSWSNSYSAPPPTANDSLLFAPWPLIMSCLGYSDGASNQVSCSRFPVHPTDECQVVFQKHASDAVAHQLSVTVNWRHEKVWPPSFCLHYLVSRESPQDLLNIFLRHNSHMINT